MCWVAVGQPSGESLDRQTPTTATTPQNTDGAHPLSSDFALLWLKQSVTALCDALFGATLIIWVSTSTNSPFSVGLALAALGVPYVLFGPFAEAATERWSRRRTMFVTDVVRGLLTFFLCIAILPVSRPNALWRSSACCASLLA